MTSTSNDPQTAAAALPPVAPSCPNSPIFQKLNALARNLWWTWRVEIRTIFRDLDAELFRGVQRNPLSFLKRCDYAEIEERAHDLEIHARIDRALRHLREYLNPQTTWGL